MKIAKIYFIFLLLITFCYSLATYAATEFGWRTMLHLAGQQRMLTQKMSKEILFIAQGIEIERNRKSIQKTAKGFQWVLTGLVNGDLYMIKTKNPAIQQQLNKVVQLWNLFHQTTNQFLQGDMSPAIVKKIAIQNMPVLKEMNKVVEMYEDESYPTLTKHKANILNLAGKMRMLTQKMTKERLLIVCGIAPEENKVRLNKTMTLFERLLKGFLHGDAELGLQPARNGAIRFKFRQVREKWLQYEAMLKKSDLSKDDLLQIAKFNRVLLRTVNNAFKILR